MSVNTSSSFNASLPTSPLSSPPNLFAYLHYCFRFTTTTVIITSLSITSILVTLPLCTFVLYLGVQRWRQQRSGTMTSHSDFFAYHMAVAELLRVAGLVACCSGQPVMIMVGITFCCINTSAQTSLHILTCVERYVAVIHPVTYLSLRSAKGIRIRCVAIGCVWLLCLVDIAYLHSENQDFMDIMSHCLSAFVLAVISFCSLSVLSVLIRPRPGDSRKNPQSKLRALYTMMAILGVLLFRYGGDIITNALYDSLQLTEGGRCGVYLSSTWFTLPSSLVLPLLFLHRAGKLPCCMKNSDPG